MRRPPSDKSIDALPETVLRAILSMLSAADLFLRANRVCTQWRNIISEEGVRVCTLVHMLTGQHTHILYTHNRLRCPLIFTRVMGMSFSPLIYDLLQFCRWKKRYFCYLYQGEAGQKEVISILQGNHMTPADNNCLWHMAKYECNPVNSTYSCSYLGGDEMNLLWKAVKLKEIDTKPQLQFIMAATSLACTAGMQYTVQVGLQVIFFPVIFARLSDTGTLGIVKLTGHVNLLQLSCSYPPEVLKLDGLVPPVHCQVLSPDTASCSCWTPWTTGWSDTVFCGITSVC